MRVTSVLVLSLLQTAAAFTNHAAAATTTAFTRHSLPCLFMSTPTEAAPIEVTGQNVELTDALIEHVNKRIGSTLNKLASGGAVQECDVVLSVSKNPSVKDGHRVEVVTNLKGTTIICQNESPDMYASIDMAAHALNRKLRKYKERRMDGWHGGDAMSDDLMAAFESLAEIEVEEEEESFFVDPEAPTVTKVDSFNLEKPMALQEAIFALDYIDHDFYVFRSEDTDKISVVYKRHLGGVGLIEP